MARTRGEKNGWFVSAIAIALFIASACVALNNLWFMRSAVETKGIVVSNREEERANRGGKYTIYIPTVEFFDARGAVHRIEATSARERIPVGTTLPIMYPRGDPASARVGGFLFWQWPVGLALMGVLFLMFGCFLIVVSRWLANWGVPMRT